MSKLKKKKKKKLGYQVKMARCWPKRRSSPSQNNEIISGNKNQDAQNTELESQK